MNLKELFKDVPEGTKKLGVVGYPLGHTISPVMQTAAAEALGLKIAYRAMEVPPDSWKDFFRQAHELPLDGFNVTVPYKARALQDWMSGGDEVVCGEEATLCGAANTVDREEEGGQSLWGLYNTDGYGFADDLEAEGVDISGKNIVLLGAGGAARAILSVFERLDPVKFTVNDIDAERADHLVKEFREKLNLPEERLSAVTDASDIKRAVKEAALLVNATPVGLSPGGLPVIEENWLHEDLIVYDLVYHRETELLRAARKAGAGALGGLGMLVRQGAKSFQIWFGRKAPFETMRKAAQEVLEKRTQDQKGARP